MSKMAEIMLDIEELLIAGYKPTTISAMLKVPVEWVHETENNLMQLADPRFYGPDYDE